MARNAWHTAEVQPVRVEHKRYPFRKLGNKLLPNHVNPPPERHGPTDIRSGDTIIYPDGRRRKIGIRIASMEANKYAFTTRPLPGAHVEQVSSLQTSDSPPPTISKE
jgi:hypothetical protein